MRNRLSSCFLILVFASVTRSANASFVFRVGAVLSNDPSGKTGEMRDARHGYELFYDMANRSSTDTEFMMLGRNGTTRFNMKYEFVWRDDNSKKGKHKREVRKLLDGQNLTFLLGSHPIYAAKEMKMSNRRDLLNFQCCVGPDSFYEDHDYKKVFGIHVSNRKYLLSTMIKLSLEKVHNLSIIVDESNEFTRTTCEEAWNLKNVAGNISDNMNQSEYRPLNGTDLKDFAEEAMNKSVEAVIACVSKSDGKKLVNAFHDIKYPLKAFFLTVGPTSQKWIDDLSNPNRTDSLLSAAQWHKDMQYKDDFFGDGAAYAKKYKKKYEEEATYVSASASATGLILHYAIKKAFEDCNLSDTNGNLTLLLYNSSAIECGNKDSSDVTGYDRVVKALGETDVEIFFGKVKFNSHRRNDGNIPVTTQVFKNEVDQNGSESSSIKAVLPLNHATTSKFRFPAWNYYKEQCTAGSYIGPDDFNHCLKCEKGSVSEKDKSKDCDSCHLGTYMDTTGGSECTKCPDGTTTLQKGSTARSDCTCEKGYYNIDSKPGEPCKACPHGATCEGELSLPYPQESFWMDQTMRNTTYSCDPGSVCLGNFTCRPGNTGRLCAECEDGYYSIFQRCTKCPSGIVVALLFIGLLTIWYLINVVVSRSVASLEMLLYWAQLANIIGDINLDWPPKLLKVFGVANILDFDVDTLEPTCLVKNWGFRENLTFQLCLPLFISLLAAVGYSLSKLARFLVRRNILHLEDNKNKLLSWFVFIPNSKEELSNKWDSVIGTFFAFVDVTYITLTKYCLDAFECRDIAGVRVLRSSPSVLCGTTQHHEIVTLGAIGLLVYVVGYVGYTTWTLFYLWKNEAFHKEKYIRRYGFIYQNFEVRCFLSPIFILIQKLLFVIVLAFVNKPVFQIGALAMIMIASLMIHVSSTPYLDAKNDILVTFLLLTLMFEAFGGVMLYNHNMSDQDRASLEWIIISTLFVLLSVFTIILLIEMFNKYCVCLVQMFQKTLAARRRDSNAGLPWIVSIAPSSKGILETTVSFDEATDEGRQQTQLLELADTFKPWYVYQCMQIDPTFTKDWDKLTNLYFGFLSCHSSASYWSLRPSAKFWRRMVNQFPEVVDFLAVADEETLEHFNDIATRLYKDFVLANQVLPLPLMKLLNSRDRAPMAHWLSVASREDKQFFVATIRRMLVTIGHESIADSMHMKLNQNGQDVFLKERIAPRHMKKKQKKSMQLIASGASPLEKPSIVDIRNLLSMGQETKMCKFSSLTSGRKVVPIEKPSENEDVPDNISGSQDDDSGSDLDFLQGSWSEDLSETRPIAYDYPDRTSSANCSY